VGNTTTIYSRSKRIRLGRRAVKYFTELAAHTAADRPRDDVLHGPVKNHRRSHTEVAMMSSLAAVTTMTFQLSPRSSYSVLWCPLHSAFRSRVVPEPPEDTTAHRPPSAAGDQLELLGEEDDRAPKALRCRWAWLLAHIFAADLESPSLLPLQACLQGAQSRGLTYLRAISRHQSQVERVAGNVRAEMPVRNER
jgi:hypothetical protein